MFPPIGEKYRNSTTDMSLSVSGQHHPTSSTYRMSRVNCLQTKREKRQEGNTTRSGFLKDSDPDNYSFKLPMTSRFGDIDFFLVWLNCESGDRCVS